MTKFALPEGFRLKKQLFREYAVLDKRKTSLKELVEKYRDSVVPDNVSNDSLGVNGKKASLTVSNLSTRKKLKKNNSLKLDLRNLKEDYFYEKKAMGSKESQMKKSIFFFFFEKNLYSKYNCKKTKTHSIYSHCQYLNLAF